MTATHGKTLDKLNYIRNRAKGFKNVNLFCDKLNNNFKYIAVPKISKHLRHNSQSFKEYV